MVRSIFTQCYSETRQFSQALRCDAPIFKRAAQPCKNLRKQNATEWCYTFRYELFSPPSGCQSIPALLIKSNWLKLIKIDWSWLKLIENDRISIELDWNLTRIWGKTIEIAQTWLRRWRMERGVKKTPNFGRREKTPTPKTRVSIWTLLRTPRPLYYKTPPCVSYHKKVCSKAVFGP